MVPAASPAASRQTCVCFHPDHQRRAVKLTGDHGTRWLWVTSPLPSAPIPRYLNPSGLGSSAARTGWAPQAPQEVPEVQEVLVDAVVRAAGLQVHLEALAGQDDGRGVFIGLQDVLCSGREAGTP